MEERTQRMKPGKISFRRQPSKNSRMNERLEKINEVNVMELSSREKSGQSERQCPVDYPKSPYHAMEFLSRTWSPSSDDFFKLFSVNNLVPRLEGKDDIEEEHEDLRMTENEVQIQCNIQAEELNMEHKKTWPVHEIEHQIGKMKFGQPKSWLSRELLRNILKLSRKGRKDERRLHVSQVNAALSVANLAAAISGILANSSFDPNKHGKNMMNIINGGHEECDQMKMNSVLASAAALIATVCAEAAESVGAQRSHISSAISSGLQTRTSAGMLDLTANAATSLRGVATLEKRAASKLYISDDQKMLSNGSKLRICTPAGKVEPRRVRIYLKHNKLILLLGKKLMGGFITTCKEYRIIDVMEDREGGGCEFTEDECGMHFVAIATSEGTIKLLFQDKQQFKAWKSSISHLLFCSHG